MSICLSLLFNNTPCLPKHQSTIALLYDKCMLYMSCHLGPLNSLMLYMDQVKLLDILTSRHVSHAMLPHAVCFATSRLATMQHVVISAAVNGHLSH